VSVTARDRPEENLTGYLWESVNNTHKNKIYYYEDDSDMKSLYQ
jgi:hypothetical protein